MYANRDDCANRSLLHPIAKGINSSPEDLLALFHGLALRQAVQVRDRFPQDVCFFQARHADNLKQIQIEMYDNKSKHHVYFVYTTSDTSQTTKENSYFKHQLLLSESSKAFMDIFM